MEKILGLTEDEIRACGYATHLPVLDFLLDEIQPKKVLEWGMGFYSTPLLIEKTKVQVCSIETASEEWYKKIHDKYSLSPNFSIRKKISKTGALEILSDIEEDWDLVFNDGDTYSRHIIAQAAQYWNTVIVSHDTQEKQYFYNAVLLREGWVWMDIKDYSVWTSVLCNRPKLLEILSRKFQITKQYRNDELRNKEFTNDHGRVL